MILVRYRDYHFPSKKDQGVILFHVVFSFAFYSIPHGFCQFLIGFVQLDKLCVDQDPQQYTLKVLKESCFKH
jgi:hypothetical protein